MPVEWLDVSSTTPRIAYVATAAQTVFVVPFAFLSEDHLEIYVDDVLQVLSTDYVTSGEEDDAGGSVTLNDALVGGESVVIARVVAYELVTHIPTTGPLDVPAINLQFSLLEMQLQQAVADLPRSLRQPTSDVDDFDALPVAASRALKYLAFDADGQPLMSDAQSGSPTSAFMATVLDDTTAAAARATLGITDASSYVGLSNFHHTR